MTGHIKIRLMLTAVAVFVLSQLGWAQAANLRDVRTGKHEKFTRVVFEFKDNVLFESPEIKGKGKFSLVFLDSTTKLPRLTLLKTGPIQLVQSIELVQQKPNLTANVQLSFPYFILKSFSLSSPSRVVVDAYQVFSQQNSSEPKETLRETPLTETSTTPEEKELENPPQNESEKAGSSNPIKLPDVKKSELKETPSPENTFSKTSSDQITEKQLVPSNFTKGNSMTQIYLLTVLNVLTGVIVVLMIFTLLKKKHMIDVGHLYEIIEFLKTSDESIDTIDAQLKKAFKEYDDF